MRLTATATLYQFRCIFHQFAGIQAFGYQLFAQHNHQRTFLTVFDSCHKEDLFVRIAFAFDLESQVFDSIDIGLTPEYDNFNAVTLNRFGDQIFLQLLNFFFQIIAYLLFQFGILLDGLLDGLRQIRHIVEHRTQFTQGILQHEGVILSTFGRYRFNTAYTCRDRAFANHTQGTDHAGCRDMRTTAQLDRVTVFNHTDFITILFTEQSHGTQCFRFGNRHIAMFFQRIVGTDLFAHQLFHLTDFFVRHFLEVGEVKTQRVGRNV